MYPPPTQLRAAHSPQHRHSDRNPTTGCLEHPYPLDPQEFQLCRSRDPEKMYMDFVPGTCKKLLSLTAAEKTTVSERVKEMINELLTIPPDYFGNFDSTPYINGVLSRPEMVNRTLNNHRTVFTHGDLQPKKYILLIGICPAGTPSTGIFAPSTLYCQMKPDWLEFVPVSGGISHGASCLLVDLLLMLHYIHVD
ncbi:Pc13g10560, partial [Penicillium rubens Wisconsin 54-1255]